MREKGCFQALWRMARRLLAASCATKSATLSHNLADFVAQSRRVRQLGEALLSSDLPLVSVLKPISGLPRSYERFCDEPFRNRRKICDFP